MVGDAAAADDRPTGYDPATGTIDGYVAFVQQADGDHLMFSPTGNGPAAGISLPDLKQTLGLNVNSLYQSHNLLL